MSSDSTDQQTMVQITKAFLRASKHKVGTKQLPLLLIAVNGVGLDRLAEITKAGSRVTYSRMRTLVIKGMIESVMGPKGEPFYKPTEKGSRIISDILNIK